MAEDGAEVWTALAGTYTSAAGYAFLVFNLLCAPCFAAIGAIRREMNSAKWTWFAIGYQTIFAYVISLIVYQLGSFVLYGSFGIGTAAALIFLTTIIVNLFMPVKTKVYTKAAAGI